MRRICKDCNRTYNSGCTQFPEEPFCNYCQNKKGLNWHIEQHKKYSLFPMRNPNYPFKPMRKEPRGEENE